MPTRNSLSLISLGTPTSMGLTPKPRLRPTRGGYRRKLAVGTLALALRPSLCYKQGRLAAALEEPANLREFRRGQRMSSIGRLKALTFAAVAALALGSADAGVLDKARQDKALRIAFRDDAPPFSFTDSSGLPAGFMIDLCGSVVKHIGEQLDISDLKISYVLVTAENRLAPTETPAPPRPPRVSLRYLRRGGEPARQRRRARRLQRALRQEDRGSGRH